MRFKTTISKAFWKLLCLKPFKRFEGSFNLSVPVIVEGRPLILPVSNAYGPALVVPPAAWSMVLYSRLLPAFPGVFLDIGCNQGQTFVQWLWTGAAHGQYIGVDAQPGCVAYVGRLAMKNGMDQARVVCVALGGGAGFAELQCGGGGL